MSAAYAREGGYGAPTSVIHVGAASHPADAIVVPDAGLLYRRNFTTPAPISF